MQRREGAAGGIARGAQRHSGQRRTSIAIACSCGGRLSNIGGCHSFLHTWYCHRTAPGEGSSRQYDREKAYTMRIVLLGVLCDAQQTTATALKPWNDITASLRTWMRHSSVPSISWKEMQKSSQVMGSCGVVGYY